MLVRDKAEDQLPHQGAVLVAVGRAMGYPLGFDPGQLVDDYRRTARRARRVVEKIFYAPVRESAPSADDVRRNCAERQHTESGEHHRPDTFGTDVPSVRTAEPGARAPPSRSASRLSRRHRPLSRHVSCST